MIKAPVMTCHTFSYLNQLLLNKQFDLSDMYTNASCQFLFLTQLSQAKEDTN